MQFGNGIVTTKGLELLSAASINDRIVFTRFVFCGENVTLGATSTTISSPWGDGHVDSYDTNSTNSFVIHASASNKDSHGYAYGWGVYGRLESHVGGQEYLLFVANHTGTVTYVDSMSGAATRFLLALTIKYSIDSAVITIDPTYEGLVSNVVFQSLANRVVTTHSATSDVVGDDQVIYGQKTFVGILSSEGMVNLGRISSSNTYLYITPTDQGNGFARVHTRTTTGRCELTLGNQSTGGAEISSKIYGSDNNQIASVIMGQQSGSGYVRFNDATILANHIYPTDSVAYNIGSIGRYWQDVYAQRYYAKGGFRATTNDWYGAVDPGEVVCDKLKTDSVNVGDASTPAGTQVLTIEGDSEFIGRITCKNVVQSVLFKSDYSYMIYADDMNVDTYENRAPGPIAWCDVLVQKIGSSWSISQSSSRAYGIVPELSSGGILSFRSQRILPRAVLEVKILGKASGRGMFDIIHQAWQTSVPSSAFGNGTSDIYVSGPIQSGSQVTVNDATSGTADEIYNPLIFAMNSITPEETALEKVRILVQIW